MLIIFVVVIILSKKQKQTNKDHLEYAQWVK